MTGAWMSKGVGRGLPVGSTAKAHFVLEGGATACSAEVKRDGTKKLAAFKCAWTERLPHDHVCGSCIRMGAPPVECTCGRCSVVPNAPSRVSSRAGRR